MLSAHAMMGIKEKHFAIMIMISYFFHALGLA